MKNLKPLEVTKEYYHNILNMLPTDKRVYVYDEVISDKYYLVFDGLPIGGFTTNYNGELNGLFSLKRGLGREIFKLRLVQAKKDCKGECNLHLFCIGDFLKDLYREFDFKVDEVIEWDDTLSPKGWNYEKQGRPTLYTMSLA